MSIVKLVVPSSSKGGRTKSSLMILHPALIGIEVIPAGIENERVWLWQTSTF